VSAVGCRMPSGHVKSGGASGESRAQGKTNREIKRCLVRYLARQLYRLLETQPALDAT
jgi:hypothetical protein